MPCPSVVKGYLTLDYQWRDYGVVAERARRGTTTRWRDRERALGQRPQRLSLPGSR